MLHDVIMEVRLYWVLLDLFESLGLAGEAAHGVELAGMSPLRQADLVVCRNISRLNNETALRHVGWSILVLLFDGVLPLGTRRVVPLGEHRVLVGVENRRAFVADTVEAVHKQGCQGLVEQPRHTSKRVALCLASSVNKNHQLELYKTLGQRQHDVTRALRLPQ